MNKQNRKGQGLVEFAVVMPMILTLIMGIVEFGCLMIIYTGATTASREAARYISIRDAAQEGAAYASIAPSDVTGIRSRVRDTSSEPLDLSSFSDDQIDIVVSGSACAGNTVSVTVEYDFNIVAPFIAGNTLHLEAEAIDTILQPPC